MNKSGLKSCPFCGETVDIYVREKIYNGPVESIKGTKVWYVQCYFCDCRTGNCFDGDWEHWGLHSRQYAIDSWNIRVGHESAGHRVLNFLKRKFYRFRQLWRYRHER